MSRLAEVQYVRETHKLVFTGGLGIQWNCMMLWANAGSLSSPEWWILSSLAFISCISTQPRSKPDNVFAPRCCGSCEALPMRPLGSPAIAAGSIPAPASCSNTTAMFLRLTQGTCLIYRSWVLLAPLQISDLLAVFNDKLHMFNSSAILFSSFRTLRWIGSSRGDLLQFNLSSCFSTFSCTPLTAVHLHKPKTGISPFSSEWGPPQKTIWWAFSPFWPYFLLPCWLNLGILLWASCAQILYHHSYVIQSLS